MNEIIKNIKPSDDEEMLKRRVKRILGESNQHLRDRSFRFITDARPKPVHPTFEFPGKLIKTEKLNAHTNDKRILEMDYACIIVLEEGSKLEVAADIEQQSDLPNYDKTGAILNYSTYLTIKTKLPSLRVVITHKKPKKEVIDHIYEGYPVRIYYIYVSPEKITQRLNILEDKISNNEILSEEESMNFPYIAIFADEDAKNIMEKLTKLFTQIEDIDYYLKIDISYVITNMIKYHFKDDVEKQKELLYMIAKVLDEYQFDKLTSLDKVVYERDILQKELIREKEANNEKDNTIQEKDKTIKRLQAKIDELEKG